ncbi:DUF3397 family protein [Lactobacillus sp. S2-2]|uniref:DUF3397 family protein n=1 Tax=Lactobacillus sp. S2-2 TaxID=2692917 RepID=UPI001F8B919B|nr:DUF3397 family protein [Lactobacillus sp. S2-2]
MDILNNDFSFGSVFLAIIIQFIIFFGFYLILKIVKSHSKNRFIQKIKYFDLLPILTIFFIKYLTTNQHGYSLLPYVILIWSIFGIALLFMITKNYKELILSRFWLVFWRFGDLLLGFSWLFSIIYRIIKVL